jgi:hypothetical protein
LTGSSGLQVPAVPRRDRPTPVIRLLNFPALKAPFDPDGNGCTLNFDKHGEHLPT